MRAKTISILLAATGRVLFAVCLSGFGRPAFGQGADTWQKCVGNTNAPIADGFGSGLTQKVESVESFNGFLYAGVGDDTNLPSVWRSSDLIHWTNVTPAVSNATEILFMTHSENAIFFCTQNSGGNNSGQIWKSADGLSWEWFNSPADGWTNAGQNVDSLGNDGTTLFAGTGLTPTNGGQVWKRPLDGSSNWVQIFSLPAGITSTWLLSLPLNGTNALFLTTSAWPITQPSQAWLYESFDGGSTWTTNPAVGNGFGNTNNLNLAWLVVFNGYLYGGIHNSTEGSELWRVPTNNIDGPWTRIPSTTNGFGLGAVNSELHRATVAAGCLWVATLTAPSLGSQVWRSSDGTNFVQSNLSGFNPANKASLFCAINGFGTNVVWGGGSPSSGAQLWRTAPPWFVISQGTPADWMNQYALTNDTEDTDRDTLLNWEEYVAGTDPTADVSAFILTNVTSDATGFILRWSSITNRLYEVERATNLAETGFAVLTSNIPPTPPLNVHTDAAILPNAVYRIRVKRP